MKEIRKQLEIMLRELFNDDEIEELIKDLPDDKLIEATAEILKVVLACDNKNLN